MAKAASSRASKQNQQRNLMIIGGVVAFLAVLGLVIYMQNRSNQTFEINDPAFAAYAGIPLDDSVDSRREIERADDVTDGVVRGVLEDGTPYIGSPDAPVVLAEFSDFSCPHCATYSPNIELLIRQYVRSGQLRIEYRPVTFVGGNLSIVAAQGALCAAEQGAFWEYHKELFRIQQSEAANSFTPTRMRELASDLGLDADELRSCMNSRRPDRALNATQSLMQEYGVNATPTLMYRLQGQETWSRFVDASGQPISTPSNLNVIRSLIEQSTASATGG